MKVMSIAAVLALAVGFSLASVDDADAWCGVDFRCTAAVLVPTPHPIPLRRVRSVVVAPAACDTPWGRVAVAPLPCGAPCPTSYHYMLRAYYADSSKPAYAGSCNNGPGNCYWRRNCWYDSFGRRFCN